MANLLALDQASRTSGYAVFIDGELKDHGTFTFSDDNIDTRLVKIKQRVLELIDKYSINKVVFEDIQQQGNVANNIQTFKVLAEVYGVIAATLQERNIPHESILASSWKSALGVKGRTRPEQKKNAQMYVQATYGVKPSQDACDAICIGSAYLKSHSCAWAT